MNNLVSKQNLTLDSREVAKMVGKDHKNLLRDINTYISQMKQANEDSSKLSTPINPTDYFIESLYVNSQNKTQPCYLLTKLGCEFVSNKLTGVKGTAFTAIYTKKFNDMEASINTGLDTSQLSPSLQMFSKIFESLANAELGQRNYSKVLQKLKRKHLR
ncbi:Rha family transcriptional regulator [Clostridium ljungdahlii]|uniref:Rha family transcriptional regulator n=1 Tax=Clostridium ljungdahlii TaxID=1538 RepID=UPI003864DFD4